MTNINMQQTAFHSKDPGEFQPPPDEPGVFWARVIRLGWGGQESVDLPKRVKVVSGIENNRGHQLLVETGLDRPHHCSLNCYRWGPPTINELERMNSPSSYAALLGR